MNRLAYFLCLLLLTAGLAGCQKDDDNVVVRFEGGTLTVEDLAAHRQSMQRMSHFRDKPEMLTPDFVFEHALNMEMIIAKGLSEELHHDPRIRNMLHEHMSDLFLKVMQDELITPVDKNKITEEQMRTFYKEHKDQYQEKPKYTLRAFNVDPAKALEAAEAIETGRLTFAEAAKQYALEEKERNNGGYTGSRTLRRFQPAWQPVVSSLEVGKPYGPTIIDDKSYLLLLENKSKSYQYSFEEKKAYIKNDVLYSAYKDQWQQVYDQLRKTYKVNINEDRLNRFYAESEKAEATASTQK